MAKVRNTSDLFEMTSLSEGNSLARQLSRPPSARVGSTVAVVSPSYPGAKQWPQRKENLERTLRGWGFDVRFYSSSHKSETPSQRAAWLHKAFLEPDVDVILAGTGGNEAIAILPHLDFELIRTHPKIFQGSSDITAIHVSVGVRSSLATFYGPNGLLSLAEAPSVHPYTTKSVLNAWQGIAPLSLRPSSDWSDDLFDLEGSRHQADPRKFRRNPGWHVLLPGRTPVIRGILDGGCLEALCWHYQGVFIHNEQRIVLFDIALAGERLSPGRFGAGPEKAMEWMESLIVRGYLEGAVALLIGRPRGYSAAQTSLLRSLLCQRFSESTLAVILDVDLSHTDPFAVWPLGREAELDLEEHELRTLEPITVQHTPNERE